MTSHWESTITFHATFLEAEEKMIWPIGNLIYWNSSRLHLVWRGNEEKANTNCQFTQWCSTFFTGPLSASFSLFFVFSLHAQMAILIYLYYNFGLTTEKVEYTVNYGIAFTKLLTYPINIPPTVIIYGFSPKWIIIFQRPNSGLFFVYFHLFCMTQL